LKLNIFELDLVIGVFHEACLDSNLMRVLQMLSEQILFCEMGFLRAIVAIICQHFGVGGCAVLVYQSLLVGGAELLRLADGTRVRRVY